MRKTHFINIVIFPAFSFLCMGVLNAQIASSADQELEAIMTNDQHDEFTLVTQYATETVNKKETEIDELITLAHETPEEELTSEESLILRETIALKTEELLTLLKIHASTINEDYYANLLKRMLFNSQAYLAEWKALSAKSALNNNNYPKAIKEARSAIEARHCASEIAEEFGWTKKANIQTKNQNWPKKLENEARAALLKEIEYLEVLSKQIESKINILGEKKAYTNEGLSTRKNYIKTLKLIEEKYHQIEYIKEYEETTFRRLTHEAESYTIQAKLFLDLELNSEALFYAEKAISKREEASHKASILGWTIESIFQLEFAGWPSTLAEQAKNKIS